MTHDVESLYQGSGMGETMYREVLRHQPRKIVEFGVYCGYSAVHMAKALQSLGSGQIVSYDLWDKCPYRHTTMAEAQKNIDRHEVSGLVDLREGDFFEWIENPEFFDFLYLDISNDGAVIELAYDRLHQEIETGQVVVMFEGGTPERDRVKWMLEYSKKPIHPLRQKLRYEILYEGWPGLPIIARTGRPQGLGDVCYPVHGRQYSLGRQ